MKKLIFSLFFFYSLCSFSQKDSTKELYEAYQFNQVIKILEAQADLSYNEVQYLAKSYLQIGQTKDAKNIYRKALVEDSSSSILKNELAKCYEKLAIYDSSLFIYQELIDSFPKNSYYQRQIADLYDKKGDILKALSNYQKAVELNAKDLQSVIRLSEIFIQVEQFDTADSLLNKYLIDFPNSKALFKNKVKVDYKNRNYTSSIKQAEKLFALHDSDLVVQKIAGISYYHEKEYDKAIVLISNVTEVAKKSEVLFYYLGLCYRENGDHKKASEFLEKAIDLGVSENLGNYYTQLAVSYEEQKDYANAIQAYKVAYKSSKDKVLLYHLARSYDIYYKDKSIALSYYQKYLDQDDTANEYLQNYSKHRVEELKVSKHFGLDTLN